MQRQAELAPNGTILRLSWHSVECARWKSAFFGRFGVAGDDLQRAQVADDLKGGVARTATPCLEGAAPFQFVEAVLST